MAIIPSVPTVIIDAVDVVNGVSIVVSDGELLGSYSPSIMGSALPGSHIQLYKIDPISHDWIYKIGLEAAQADVNGIWSIPMLNGSGSPALSPGEIATLYAVQVDGAGNFISEPSNNFVIIAPSLNPDDSSVPMPPENISLESINGYVENNGFTDDKQPIFSGRASIFNTVYIYDKGQAIGSVLVDYHGDWLFKPEQLLSDGLHQFSAVAVNSINGKESEETDDFCFTIGIPVSGREEFREDFTSPHLFSSGIYMHTTGDQFCFQYEVPTIIDESRKPYLASWLQNDSDKSGSIVIDFPSAIKKLEFKCCAGEAEIIFLNDIGKELFSSNVSWIADEDAYWKSFSYPLYPQPISSIKFVGLIYLTDLEWEYVKK